MKNELFELAVMAAMRIPPKNVIGTKTEHRVHGTLKYFFQPNDEYHEVKVEEFICDATDSDFYEITEIQTKSFGLLRKKLEKLLQSHPVTVIYPIISEKRIISIYSESGETTVRKSPKKSTLYDTVSELSAIREFLPHRNLTIKAVYLKIDETRIFNGTKENRKPFQKPVSVEKVPTELIKIENIDYPNFYLSFLTNISAESFTSSDFAKANSVSVAEARYLLYLLNELGLVRRIGKEKKAYIYVKAAT